MDAEKAKQEKDSGLLTLRLSIGAKLITIITIIVLASLGSITFLVSWLVREDLRIAAEDNNFEVNRRSAMETEYTLATMRSHALILIQTVNALGDELAGQTVDYFFGQNQSIAALVFSVPGEEDHLLVNKNFFLSQNIDTALMDSFSRNNRTALKRAMHGDTVLLNVTPHFSTSLLAFIFPLDKGGGCLLFSPSNLSESFSFGINQSYLINDSGDFLIHANYDLLQKGINVSEMEFIRYIWDNPAKNAQKLYTDETGARYFGAFYKLNAGGATVVTSIEYNKVFEGITATTRRNIYLTAAVLFISIMLIWFFAKSISLPLKALATAARTIEEGVFEIELHPRSHDEIGVLTTSFQRMSAALGVFGRFTNRDIAVRAMRGEIKPGGLPKQATILFSDIRGFTMRSENYTKEYGDEASDRIVGWLNNYFTQMVECVEKTTGVVDKFMGDAIMAHWGALYTSGNPQVDAFNCVKAAIAMRITLIKMNRDLKAGDILNPPIRIGCGINTGIVTAGQIGSDLRMEYTVMGAPVNLASRTEELTKIMGADILITENTWRLVNNYFITEEMPSVKVKGKEETVRIFGVVNFKDFDKGPRTMAEVRSLLDINPPDFSKIDVNAEVQIGKFAGLG